MVGTDFLFCAVINSKTANKQKAPNSQERSWWVSQIRPFPDSARSDLREETPSAKQINNLAAHLSPAVCFS